MIQSSHSRESAGKALQQIIDSASDLGVEIDEEEAIQWLTAVAAQPSDTAQVTYDMDTGVFGHRIVLLDFDPSDLDRIRRIAAVIEIDDQPNVETAISLSGSSAQSNIQTFPGDFDYFERVNIKAPSREQACTILADVIRQKALNSGHGPGYQLVEVRFGSLQRDVIRNGNAKSKGDSIPWSLAEIMNGAITVLALDGTDLEISWAEAAQDPGWCKLDYIVLDPARPRVVKASNMLDVTWEDENGKIVPLDGFIDPYYQEVYLDAASIPLFSKISKQMEPDSLSTYVRHLEHEIAKYTDDDHANYGKAAKRMYNVFRLTGKFEEAAYIRELFDEPAALLYQVGALLDGLVDLGSGENTTIDRATLTQQIDSLMRDITQVAEGPIETKLIMSLLRIRDDITGLKSLDDAWEGTLLEMQQQINELVNQHFEGQLRAVPSVSEYIDSLK